MEGENLVLCFGKRLSKTDVAGNMEIPMGALFLPAAEDNQIMNVRDYVREWIWEFKAPVRRDGSGRRYMSCQWRQFVKENALKDRDIVWFYHSTTYVNSYVVTFECEPRILQLFPGAPL